MRNRTDVQLACQANDAPSASDIDDWIRSTLDSVDRHGVELTVRIVEESEIVTLNQRYRNQDKPTDVLAFPCDPLLKLEPIPLGDVVVCASIVERNAHELGQPRDAHWARVVAHGVLHLCGYDHQTPAEANRMESIEESILHKLGMKSGKADGI